MATIILTTINARYIHAAFGLRYLKANLGTLEPHSEILEFQTTQRPLDIAEEILQHGPRIVGLGVYIWNVTVITEVVRVLTQIAPEVTVIIGGPEVSFEIEEQEVCALADFVIAGEADHLFRETCEAILGGTPPSTKVLHASPPPLATVKLPYQHYTETDIRTRLIYVEASRGCPFTCEFCLSSLEIPVRAFELDSFLNALDQLYGRGVRHFKFVDRTFNLNIRTARTILEFFLAKISPELFVHFEMVPDRLPDGLRSLIAQFPPGALQFEIGIQTFNPEVAALISRRQDYRKIEENLTYLREETGVHLHVDLIAGLPGESLESFAQGFDRLIALRPHEIQVGILKRLRGAPIARHTEPWEMVYSQEPPYEVLRTKLLDFVTMQRLRRFAKHWDLVANSGNFVATLPLLLYGLPPLDGRASPFEGFWRLSAWLTPHISPTSGIALKRLASLLLTYLEERGAGKEGRGAMKEDFQRLGRKDLPPQLRTESDASSSSSRNGRHLARRQSRHQVPSPVPTEAS